MTADEWSGRRVQQARALVATWLPAPCGQCGQQVEPDPGAPSAGWVVGHKLARATHPELTWVVSNWQPEHADCSARSARSVVLEKARLEAARAAAGAVLAADDGGLFPSGLVSRKELLPPSLSPATPRGAHTQPVEPRPELAWSPATLLAHPWTAEFADVPEDSAPPLWMSPPPADAVCSYGWSGCEHHPDDGDAIAWIEQVERKRLRWWQRLAIVRQLEHREDGSLVHKVVLESCPRRAGKSVRLRGVALWRMVIGAALFGESQLVMHTGSDIAICREVQRAAWRWAQGEWGAKAVTQANGKEQVESTEGHRWLVRAQTAVYGYDVTLGLVDEGWDVDPGTVSEGLEPAILERISPQLHLTSTAHRRATSLMRGRLSTALAVDDGQTLVIVWAAPAGSDPGDPDTWRSASPHWSSDRHEMIAAKYLAAKAGQVDPQADDPDPMAGFAAQYLNQWRLTARAELGGTPLTEDDAWAERIALHDDRPPDGAAISSWFAQGVSLALAWREGSGAIVSASGYRDLATAVAALRQSGYRGRVTLDAALASDPAVKRIPTTPTKASSAAAVTALGRLLEESVIYHDGGEHLTGQVLDVRTAPGADGVRLVSRSRADAVKAASWAATAARARPGAGAIGFVTSA